MKVTLSRATLLLTLCYTSCLPVDSRQPDCFPEDPCPRGLSCVDGQCEPPPARQLIVSLSCLSSTACQSELDARAGATSDEGGALCLILEQPQSVTVHRLDLNPSAPQTLSAPLMNSALRASLVYLSQPECPRDEAEVSAMGLGLTCATELGCVLRLRHPQRSAESISATGPVELDFSGAQGQCLARAWGAQEPVERCDGVDQDCDGFADEGLTCP